MRTLFLNPNTWRLMLDSNGNIATATDVYQIAQDIATACRVFIGDLYYRQQDGIPYNESILGKSGFPLSLYKAYLEDAALSIEGVVSASASLRLDNGRNVAGSIFFTADTGETGEITI